MIIWFTRLSGAGKSTICRAAEKELRAQGRPMEVLDGDEVRQYLRQGLIPAFTGISDPFEPPIAPDVVCHFSQREEKDGVKATLLVQSFYAAN